jgi:hypothetical protein
MCIWIYICAYACTLLLLHTSEQRNAVVENRHHNASRDQPAVQQATPGCVTALQETVQAELELYKHMLSETQEEVCRLEQDSRQLAALQKRPSTAQPALWPRGPAAAGVSASCSFDTFSGRNFGLAAQPLQEGKAISHDSDKGGSFAAALGTEQQATWSALAVSSPGTAQCGSQLSVDSSDNTSKHQSASRAASAARAMAMIYPNCSKIPHSPVPEARGRWH